MGLRKRLKGRVHLGEQDENSNWRLRDNVTYYTDQVKAAPGAARELLKAPGTVASGVREMVADMRTETPPLAPDDPALTPVEGVDLETWAAIDAALMARRVPPGDAVARDAVAQEHGVPPGVWARAAAAWLERQRIDGRVAGAYGAALQRHMNAR